MSYLNIRRLLQRVVSTVTQPLTIGGIAEDGSDAKITVTADGIVQVATPPAGDKSTRVATTAFANSLLAEYEVTGAAVTSINFAGLNINTHKSYRVEIDLNNAIASDLTLYMFVNDDTVETNYYNQYLTINNTIITCGRTNTPMMSYSLASRSSFAVGTLVRDAKGYVRCLTNINRDATNLITISTVAWARYSSVPNITKITLTASVANSIGIGSKVRIYRGDV